MDSPHRYAVRAAGGLIVRGRDRPEVVVVHRPRYDDWTIPKGKYEDGEDAVDCALREVTEETGLVCTVAGTAATVTYPVDDGLKQVHYFLMRPVRHDGFTPSDEVDEMRWVDPETGRRLLSYGFDRDLMGESVVATAAAATHIHLVRHGAAGDRSDWEGPDDERPLTKKGRAQATALAPALEPLGVTRIMSSPSVRCVQTVEPLASRLGLEIEVHPALAEGPDPRRISALLDEVAGTDTVASSHGDVIPAVLSRLRGEGVKFRSGAECAKGSTWSVGHDGAGYTEARYFPAPPV